MPSWIRLFSIVPLLTLMLFAGCNKNGAEANTGGTIDTDAGAATPSPASANDGGVPASPTPETSDAGVAHPTP